GRESRRERASPWQLAIERGMNGRDGRRRSIDVQTKQPLCFVLEGRPGAAENIDASDDRAQLSHEKGAPDLVVVVLWRWGPTPTACHGSLTLAAMIRSGLPSFFVERF